MGTLGMAMYLGISWKAGWCKHAWPGRSSDTSATGLVFRFSIPYPNGIKVSVYNPVNYTSEMASQVINIPNLDIPIRLKSSCVPYSDPISLGTPYQHINLTNTEGWLLFYGTAINGSNNNLPP